MLKNNRQNSAHGAHGAHGQIESCILFGIILKKYAHSCTQGVHGHFWLCLCANKLLIINELRYNITTAHTAHRVFKTSIPFKVAIIVKYSKSLCII